MNREMVGYHVLHDSHATQSIYISLCLRACGGGDSSARAGAKADPRRSLSGVAAPPWFGGACGPVASRRTSIKLLAAPMDVRLSEGARGGGGAAW